MIKNVIHYGTFITKEQSSNYERVETLLFHQNQYPINIAYLFESPKHLEPAHITLIDLDHYNTIPNINNPIIGISKDININDSINLINQYNNLEFILDITKIEPNNFNQLLHQTIYKHQQQQILSHDINNLLCILTGNLELFNYLTQSTTPPHQDKIKTAYYASKLLNNMLNSQNKKDHITTPELKNIFQTLKHFYPDLVYTLNDNLQPTHISPVQLTRILLNLVKNAHEAKNSNEPIICYAQLDQIDNQYYTFIQISNKGTLKNSLEEISKPGFSTKQLNKKQSRGFGLTSVINSISRNNGHILCDQKKEYINFNIYLPIYSNQ